MFGNSRSKAWKLAAKYKLIYVNVEGEQVSQLVTRRTKKQEYDEEGKALPFDHAHRDDAIERRVLHHTANIQVL